MSHHLFLLGVSLMMRKLEVAGRTSLLALMLVAACGPEPENGAAESAARPSAPTPTLSDAIDVGMGNARMPLPGLVTGAQPTQEQLTALAAAGYTRFVSLRPPEEEGAGWEEAYAAANGYDFSRLPIAGAGSLTRESVERFAEILAAGDGEPTVLYCASGNRAGAMLALKAHWLDDVPAEEALSLGLQGGLTRLETPVRELLGLEPAS